MQLFIKKIFGSRTRPSDLGKWMTLIISNEEMNDIIKMIKSLEKSGLLIKGVSGAIKNKANGQKGGLLSLLLGTLGTSLLVNPLTISKSTIRAGESKIRVGNDI